MILGWDEPWPFLFYYTQLGEHIDQDRYQVGHKLKLHTFEIYDALKYIHIRLLSDWSVIFHIQPRKKNILRDASSIVDEHVLYVGDVFNRHIDLYQRNMCKKNK